MTLDALSSAMKRWLHFVLGDEQPPQQELWFGRPVPEEPSWNRRIDADAWVSKLMSPATAVTVACISLSILAVAVALRLGWTLGDDGAITRLPAAIMGSESNAKARERRRKRAIQKETATEVDHLVKIASLIGITVQLNHARGTAPESEVMKRLGNELEAVIAALCLTQQHLSLHYSLLNDFPGLKTCFENVLENLGAVTSDLHSDMGIWSEPESLDLDDEILTDVEHMSKILTSERQSLQFINESLQRQLDLLPSTKPREAPAIRPDQSQTPETDFSFISIPPENEDLPPQYSPPHKGAKFPVMEKKSNPLAIEPDSKPIPPPSNPIIPPTALLKSITENNLKDLSSLLSAGADPNIRHGRLHRSPLHECARLNRYKHAALLIQHGALADTEDIAGDTPLHLAAWEGHIDVAAVLIKDGSVDVNRLSGRDGNAPLFCAIAVRSIDVVRLLLRHEAHLSVKAADDTYALHQAAITAQPAMCALLLERGSFVDCKDREGNTPLHYAATIGHVKTVTFLLDEGAEVNARQDRGLTPLHWACQSGYEKAVRALLESGAEVGAMGQDGVEPVHCAAVKGSLKCIKELVEAGATFDREAEWEGVSGTARQMALAGGFEEVVQFIDGLTKT